MSASSREISVTANAALMTLQPNANEQIITVDRKSSDKVPNGVHVSIVCDAFPPGMNRLMRAVLTGLAEQRLCDEMIAHPRATVPAEWFSVHGLEDWYFAQREVKSASAWLSKDELHSLWASSETWKQLSGSNAYKTNPTYQAAANAFANHVKKLAGKAYTVDETTRTTIILKMTDSDLNGPLGEFIQMRFKMMEANNSQVDLSALTANS